MTTFQILNLAEKHMNNCAMASSAKLCLEDARMFYAGGDKDLARNWAIKSLAYSVGILHADYQAATAK